MMPGTYVNTTLPEELAKKVDELRGTTSRYRFCRECIEKGVEVIKNERETENDKRADAGKPQEPRKITVNGKTVIDDFPA